MVASAILSPRTTGPADALGPESVRLWNAGGSGSLESSAADPVVTEVTGVLMPSSTERVASTTTSSLHDTVGVKVFTPV